MGTNGRRRLTGLVVAALVALAITAAGAFGALGDVTFQECIEDPPASACSGTTPGMNGTRSVSEWHGSVYTASFLDNAIVRFDRIIEPGAFAVGALIPRYCFESAEEDCGTRTTPGLGGANAVSVPPDGKSVYATSEGDNAVVAFDRRLSGGISPAGCTEDDEGADRCPRTAQGLEGASSIAAYGRSAFVAALDDDAVTPFRRDRSTSEVRALDCVGDRPDTKCPGRAFGLDGARSAAIAPSGDSLYIASYGDDAIVHFRIEHRAAKIGRGSCIEDAVAVECAAAGEGLNGAYSVVVSPDGRSVYAVSSLDDAIAHFDRNPANGALTFRGCIKNNAAGECGGSAPGMDGPQSVAISSDGRSVYVASFLDSAVAHFSRNPDTGELSFVQCVEQTVAEGCLVAAPGIGRARGVTVSLDGRSVYVAGFDDDAVVTLSRDTVSGRLTPAG